MFFFSRRKKKKDHDNIEDVVEKGTDEENLKGEISGNSEKDETYEKKDAVSENRWNRKCSRRISL